MHVADVFIIYILYFKSNGYYYLLEKLKNICHLLHTKLFLRALGFLFCLYSHLDINIMLGTFINQLFDGVYLLIVNKQIKNMYSMKKKCDFGIKKLNN